MSDEGRYARAKEIFLAAAALPEEQRAQFARHSCQSDPALLEQVLRLLKFRGQTALSDASSTAPAVDRTPTAGRDADGTIAPRATGSAQSSAAPNSSTGLGPFEPGMMVAGRYRIVALLGQGGMGQVYRADDTRLQQQVALKFLPPDRAADPAWLARLINEVRVARSITHPNVCRVHDIGEADGQTFVSMEYIDGEDLKSLLKRIGRIPLDKAEQIGRQLCLGLAAAHAHGVLHRDLKPANVMLDGRGQVRVTDFGLAALHEEVRGAEIQAGTPAYMAPEQMAGKEVTVRSDLYALGLVLYEVFTGKQAYSSGTFADISRSKRSQLPPAPSEIVEDIPVPVEQIILRCLDRDPRDRPASALAVAAALGGGDLLTLMVEAGETPSPELIAASGRKQPLPTAGAISALAAFAALLGLALWLAPIAHPVQQAGLEKGPEVLADRARALLGELAGVTEFQEQAFGFKDDLRGGLVRWIVGQRPGGDWSYATVLPGGPAFWLRRSDADLTPIDPRNVVFGNARITISDPPPIQPGMTAIVLDGAGRLLGFGSIPKAADPPTTQSAAVNWERWLERAGLSPADLTPTNSMLASSLFTAPGIGLQAWIGGGPDRPIRVEAAEFGGAPIFFAVADARAPAAQALWQDDQKRRGVMDWARKGMIALLVLVSIPLAYRNLMRGRSDLRGASRLAFFVLLIGLARWVVGIDAALSGAALASLLIFAVVGALGEAVLVWVFYVALEPAVRRLWPQSLIAWSRVLAGRSRDPLVGMHLLLGVVLGTGWAVLAFVDQLGPQLLGWDVRPLILAPDYYETMSGARPALSFALEAARQSVYQSIWTVLLLMLLRELLRREWAALLVGTVLIATLYVPSATNPISGWVLVGAGIVGSAVWATVRFGPVALATAIFIATLLLRIPLTLNLRVWYVDISLCALAAVAGLALWAFWCVRRRPATTRTLAESN